MMFKLKPVLNYLGYDDPLLDARQISRCPACSPPSTGGAAGSECTEVDALSSISALTAASLSYVDADSSAIVRGSEFWTGVASPGDGVLHSTNLTTGATTTFDVGALLGRTTFSTDGGFFLGADGDTAFMSGMTSFTVGQSAVLRVNLDTLTVTGVWGTYGAFTYGGGYMLANNTNNAFFINKGTTGSIASIDQTTLTENFVIASGFGANIGAVVLDTDKDELWVTNAATDVIKVYTASTGVLSQTLVPTITLTGSYRVRYVTAKHWMIFTVGTGVEIWSTDTYTTVGTVDPNYGVTGDVWNDMDYIPGSNELVGYFYDGATGDAKIAFASATTFVFTEFFDASLLGSPADYAHTAVYVVDRCHIMFQCYNAGFTSFYVYKTSR